jgi:hypothetical protein
MFVQVIKGKTNDAEGFNRQGEAWQTDVKPSAKGYVGSTAGVADDGTFVVLARFADEASARENNDNPAQQAWYEGFSKLVDGEPTFRESSDVEIAFDRGCDNATFVQIMEGTADRAKVKEFETDENLEQLKAARPDLLGMIRVWLDGGAYVQAAYFTREEEARTNEANRTEESARLNEQFGALFSDMTFTDLKSPALH